MGLQEKKIFFSGEGGVFFLRTFLDSTNEFMRSLERTLEYFKCIMDKNRERFAETSRAKLVSFREKTAFLREFFSIPPVGLLAFIIVQAAYIIPLSFIFGVNIFKKRNPSLKMRILGKILMGVAFLGYAATGKYHSDVGDGTPVPFIPARELITTGPYRYVRNPMFLLHILGMVGLSLLVGARRFTFGVLPLFIFINSSYLKNVEEKDLLARFGEKYLEYRNRTPFILPFFHGRF